MWTKDRIKLELESLKQLKDSLLSLKAKLLVEKVFQIEDASRAEILNEALRVQDKYLEKAEECLRGANCPAPKDLIYKWIERNPNDVNGLNELVVVICETFDNHFI